MVGWNILEGSVRMTLWWGRVSVVYVGLFWLVMENI